jgi:hypothetical protein
MMQKAAHGADDEVREPQRERSRQARGNRTREHDISSPPCAR